MVNEILGQGSYGCVYKPGINCKGNKMKGDGGDGRDKRGKKNSKFVTKLQEVHFSTKNEWQISRKIREIKDYSKRFGPIVRHCIIKFNVLRDSNLDLEGCNLFEDYFYYMKYNDRVDMGLGMNVDKGLENFAKENFGKKKYVLSHVKYINGVVLDKYFSRLGDVPGVFFSQLVSCYLYLLKSVEIMRGKNIVHNDLFSRNILVKSKSKGKGKKKGNDNRTSGIPIVIDFGLAYDYKKLFVQNKYNEYDGVDFYRLKQFFHHYKSDSFDYSIEKRFILFICFNDEIVGVNILKMSDDGRRNILDKSLLRTFVDELMMAMQQSVDAGSFFEEEFADYKKSVYEYYSRFLNKTRYPNVTDIVEELMPLVFKYDDMFSLAISFLYVIYDKKPLIAQNNDLLVGVNFIVQILKKSLHPVPEYRLDCMQIVALVKFALSGEGNNDRLLTFLNANGIDSERFLKDFIVVDFSKLFSSKAVQFIR